jgi:hypothetical protein
MFIPRTQQKLSGPAGIGFDTTDALAQRFGQGVVIDADLATE